MFGHLRVLLQDRRLRRRLRLYIYLVERFRLRRNPRLWKFVPQTQSIVRVHIFSHRSGLNSKWPFRAATARRGIFRIVRRSRNWRRFGFVSSSATSGVAAAFASAGSEFRFSALLIASSSSPSVVSPYPDCRYRITPSLSTTTYVGNESILNACNTSPDRSMYSCQSICFASTNVRQTPSSSSELIPTNSNPLPAN